MMTPEEAYKRVYGKLSVQVKITFISTVLIGFLAHFYMLTNKIPNHDDIRTSYSYGWGMPVGRWMLTILGHIADAFQMSYSLPLFNGVISILLLAAAACILVEMFEMKSKVCCILAGGLMVSFPVIAHTLFFMFTVAYYTFAILLIVLAAFVARRYKYGYLTAILFAAMSMGIYQAYFPLMAALLLMGLIIDCFYGKEEFKVILIRAVKYLGSLSGGMGLYLIMTNVLTRISGNSLSEFHSYNSMGALDLKTLPDRLARMYGNMVSLITNNELEIAYSWNIRATIAGLFALCLFLLIKQLVKGIKGKRYLPLLLGSGCVILMPAAVWAIYIMCPDMEEVYSLMIYPAVSLVLFPLLLLGTESKEKSGRISGVAQWAGVLLSTALLIFYCHYDNVQYVSMQAAFMQANSYFTTMITQIKSQEGYQKDFPVVFIGKEIEDASYYQNWHYDNFVLTNIKDENLLNVYSRDFMLKEYMGFAPVILKTDETLLQDQEIDAMPCYPADGSIKIRDGIVVVKLSDKQEED